RPRAHSRIVGVREDHETGGHAGVRGGLHLAKDVLERRHDGGPLVLLLHTARPVEDEEQVRGLPLGLGRGRRAARVVQARPRGAAATGREQTLRRPQARRWSKRSAVVSLRPERGRGVVAAANEAWRATPAARGGGRGG